LKLQVLISLAAAIEINSQGNLIHDFNIAASILLEGSLMSRCSLIPNLLLQSQRLAAMLLFNQQIRMDEFKKFESGL